MTCCTIKYSFFGELLGASSIFLDVLWPFREARGPYCKISEWDKIMVLAIVLALVWFGFIIDWSKWLIWGHHPIFQLEYMLFDIQHVTEGHKLVKTVVSDIFLVLFGFVVDRFKWDIWGCNWIPQLKYMFFYSQYVTVGQKSAKKMVEALF